MASRVPSGTRARLSTRRRTSRRVIPPPFSAYEGNSDRRPRLGESRGERHAPLHVELAAAIKIARRWGKKHRDGAFAIITAEHAFHGRTLATVTATGKEQYTRPFAPLPEGFPHVTFNVTPAFGVHERLAELVLDRAGVEPVKAFAGSEADRCWDPDCSETLCGDACRARTARQTALPGGSP